MQTLFMVFSVLVSYCNGLIVPQELPSVLSLVYSNIPPIKKGTDSRVGFGFRLGEHADFQVMFELGPQKFTKPIGKSSSDDDSDTSKRMVDQSDYSKKIQPPSPPPIEVGSSYLNRWASEMRTKTTQRTRKPQTAPVENEPLKSLFSTKNQYPLPVSPIIPESSLRQLQQLMYAKQVDAQQNEEGTVPSKRMEAHIALAAQTNFANRKKEQAAKADLSDVSLD